MRVAFISHYAELYGANHSLLGLIKGLPSLGVEPVVFCPMAGPFTEHLNQFGIAAHILPSCLSIYWPPPTAFSMPRRVVSAGMNALRRWNRQMVNRRMLPQIVGKMREERIDLVHTNEHSLSIGLKASKLIGKPHVWHIRSYGDLDYGCEPDGGRREERRLMAASNALIFNSQSVKSHYLGTSKHSCCHVIYNGIYTEAEFTALANRTRQSHNTQAPTTFAVVGYVHGAKGQFMAVEALALLARRGFDVRLVVAGEGAVAELNEHARRHNVADKVRCVGYVADPRLVYLDADVVLMCSKMEAFGRVTVEAMACGCAVVANEVGGSVEILKNEETGLFYDGTVEGLAAAMVRMTAAPDLRRQLAAAGQQDAAKKFTVERSCAHVWSVYEQVLKKSG